jgi:hypothetical protein
MLHLDPEIRKTAKSEFTNFWLNRTKQVIDVANDRLLKAAPKTSMVEYFGYRITITYTIGEDLPWTAAIISPEGAPVPFVHRSTQRDDIVSLAYRLIEVDIVSENATTVDQILADTAEELDMWTSSDTTATGNRQDFPG